MKPFRSLLFLPADKPGWVEKAIKAGPDGIILDMEDAVVLRKKVSTRAIVRKTLDDWKDRNIDISVRINGFKSGFAFDDLHDTIASGLSDVILPKAETVEEVRELDLLLRHFEHRAGLSEGKISISIILETASAMRNAYEIARSSSRIRTIALAAGPGGDAQRAIGYQWTRECKETLYMRSKTVLDARAAGVHPMITSWYDIRDVEGFEEDCKLNRQLGFRGAIVIHPSHVEIANRIFSPTEEELSYYKSLLKAYEEAEIRGHGTSVYDGAMIDYAVVNTARELIDFAKSIGIDTERS
jgi:citrate lyase subunit beta/citryl-CoA lyase